MRSRLLPHFVSYSRDHLEKIPNRQIVEELKQGIRLGCTHLMDTYQNRLIGEAVNVFHVGVDDAEELVSDVLLTVVHKIDGFEFKRSDGDFHLWVMTIFRNRVRDFVRHKMLTEVVLERFEESRLEEEEEYSGIENEVVTAIVRQYQDSLREPDGDSKASSKLQAIADALETMETWERVLLRCRALDIPYEDIATFTGKNMKQLKVYHARVKKKFVKLLSQEYPELAEMTVKDPV